MVGHCQGPNAKGFPEARPITFIGVDFGFTANACIDCLTIGADGESFAGNKLNF
jgi:hypothetical protein